MTFMFQVAEFAARIHLFSTSSQNMTAEAVRHRRVRWPCGHYTPGV